MNNNARLKNILLGLCLLSLLATGIMFNSDFNRKVLSLPESSQKMIHHKENSGKKQKRKRERVVTVKMVRTSQKKRSKKVDKRAPVSVPTFVKNGGSVVKVDAQKSGGPALVASYLLPVDRYLEWARSRGGMLVLYDVKAGRIVCRIEADGSFAVNFQNNDFSARARRLTADYPQESAILHQAKKRFGRSSYEILLLLPSALDDKFNLQIKQIIESTKKRYDSVVAVRLSYLGFRSADHLQVRVDRIETATGGIKINQQFDF